MKEISYETDVDVVEANDGTPVSLHVTMYRVTEKRVATPFRSTTEVDRQLYYDEIVTIDPDKTLPRQFKDPVHPMHPDNTSRAGRRMLPTDPPKYPED